MLYNYLLCTMIMYSGCFQTDQYNSPSHWCVGIGNQFAVKDRNCEQPEFTLASSQQKNSIGLLIFKANLDDYGK